MRLEPKQSKAILYRNTCHSLFEIFLHMSIMCDTRKSSISPLKMQESPFSTCLFNVCVVVAPLSNSFHSKISVVQCTLWFIMEETWTYPQAGFYYLCCKIVLARFNFKWQFFSCAYYLLPPFPNICLSRHFKWTQHTDVCRHILKCRFTHFASYVVTWWNL